MKGTATDRQRRVDAQKRRNNLTDSYRTRDRSTAVFKQYTRPQSDTEEQTWKIEWRAGHAEAMLLRIRCRDGGCPRPSHVSPRRLFFLQS